MYYTHPHHCPDHVRIRLLCLKPLYILTSSVPIVLITSAPPESSDEYYIGLEEAGGPKATKSVAAPSQCH